MKVKLQDGERVEDLQFQDLKIVQNKNLYTFTSDSVVLANFVKTKKSDIVAEIGAGSGVISLLVQAKNQLEKIYAFELQEEMAKLCLRNVELNNVQEKIEVIHDDVKNFEKYLQQGSIDVVISNPPYFKVTNFPQSKVKKLAKEEVELSCCELVKISSQMLKQGGRLFCCYSAERACELIVECEKQNLIAKELFFTENGKGKVKLVVIKAVKGAKEGCKIYPNLVTNEENGDYLEILHTKNFGR